MNPLLLALLGLGAIALLGGDTRARAPAPPEPARPPPGPVHLPPPGPPPPPSSRGAGLPDSFWRSLWTLAATLGADPVDLATILYSESKGIDPSQMNASYCVGINQFCPDTFGAYVYGSKARWDALTHDQRVAQIERYRQLDAEAQLVYVGRFWQDIKRVHPDAFASARNVYYVNFVPGRYQANAPDSLVIARSPDPVYTANMAFDHPLRPGGPRKGYITAGDMKSTAQAVQASPGFASIRARIQANAGLAA